MEAQKKEKEICVHGVDCRQCIGKFKSVCTMYTTKSSNHSNRKRDRAALWHPLNPNLKLSRDDIMRGPLWFFIKRRERLCPRQQVREGVLHQLFQDHKVTFRAFDFVPSSANKTNRESINQSINQLIKSSCATEALLL